jgi:hypothetical protein
MVMRKPTRNLAVVTAVLLAAIVLSGPARADPNDEGERGDGPGRRRPPTADPAGAALYRKECGACHLAFPPRMLSAEGWTRILAGLDRHFGQNAELDLPTRELLASHLVAGAGRPDRGGGDPTRITDAPWFRDEHAEARRAATRPSIRTLANCAACHPGAEAGDFDEHRTKVPAN